MKSFLSGLVVSAALASVAGAQCPIFLIPPSASITDDEDGKSPWNLVERTDWVIGVPGMGTWAVGFVKLDDSLATTNNGPACFEDKIKVNRKSGRAKIWIQNEKTGKPFEKWLKITLPLNFPKAWEAKGHGGPWVKSGEDIAIATFEPQNVENWRLQSASTNWRTISHAASVALDVIKNADFKAPEIETQRTFPADFDKVWSAVIETLSDQKWQIESVDKGSGLVTTKPAVGGRADVVCGTKYDKDHKTWLNIFVKKTDTGTRVKVNATFHAIREDDVINCYSNGTVEKELFEAIRKNLAG
jgi:hypothetical protein